MASNTGWNNAPVVSTTEGISPNQVQTVTAALSAKVGAFGLAAGSADSAMVVTLSPGAYTAQVTDANGQTGIALVEIYELR
jgi:hypothetical protein